MEIRLRVSAGGICEVTVHSFGDTLKADVANISGEVDTDFIDQLRDVADTLEEQNKLVKDKR